MDFLDRLAHFHDEAREDPQLAKNIPTAGRNLTGEQVLRSLPDKGKLLDEHLNVEVVQQNLGSKTNDNVAAQSSPAPPVTPSQGTSSPALSERVWVPVEPRSP